MKTTIFSLLMACGVTAFGQFIPQPNAYNPDANGDSFIGVDDVMGTLALYGNAFENSDSLQIYYHEVEDQSPYEIQPDTDILFVHATGGVGIYDLVLPEVIGWKTITVMMTHDSPALIQYQFFVSDPESLNFEIALRLVNVTHASPKSIRFTHAPNGTWYRPA